MVLKTCFVLFPNIAELKWFSKEWPVNHSAPPAKCQLPAHL